MAMMEHNIQFYNVFIKYYWTIFIKFISILNDNERRRRNESFCTAIGAGQCLPAADVLHVGFRLIRYGHFPKSY
jgi:hypothetical protein